MSEAHFLCKPFGEMKHTRVPTYIYIIYTYSLRYARRAKRARRSLAFLGTFTPLWSIATTRRRARWACSGRPVQDGVLPDTERAQRPYCAQQAQRLCRWRTERRARLTPCPTLRMAAPSRTATPSRTVQSTVGRCGNSYYIKSASSCNNNCYASHNKIYQILACISFLFFIYYGKNNVSETMNYEHFKQRAKYPPGIDNTLHIETVTTTQKIAELCELDELLNY